MKAKSTGSIRLKKSRKKSLWGKTEGKTEGKNMFRRGVFGCMKDCWKGKENTIAFGLIFNE